MRRDATRRDAAVRARGGDGAVVPVPPSTAGWSDLSRRLDTEREKNRGLEEVLDRMFQDGQGPAEYQRTYNAHRYGSPR